LNEWRIVAVRQKDLRETASTISKQWKREIDMTGKLAIDAPQSFLLLDGDDMNKAMWSDMPILTCGQQCPATLGSLTPRIFDNSDLFNVAKPLHLNEAFKILLQNKLSSSHPKFQSPSKVAEELPKSPHTLPKTDESSKPATLPMSPVPQLAHNKLEAADAVRDPVLISEKPSAKAAETDKSKVDKAGLFSGKAFLQNPFTSTHEASSASSGAAYTAGLDFFAVPNLGGLFRASKTAAGVSNQSDAVAPRKPVHKQTTPETTIKGQNNKKEKQEIEPGNNTTPCKVKQML
jgi:hypothetical protein